MNMTTYKSSDNLPSPETIKTTLDLYLERQNIMHDAYRECELELANLKLSRQRGEKPLEKERRKQRRANRQKLEEKRLRNAEEAERKRESKLETLARVYRVRIMIE